MRWGRLAVWALGAAVAGCGDTNAADLGAAGAGGARGPLGDPDGDWQCSADGSGAPTCHCRFSTTILIPPVSVCDTASLSGPVRCYWRTGDADSTCTCSAVGCGSAEDGSACQCGRLAFFSEEMAPFYDAQPGVPYVAQISPFPSPGFPVDSELTRCSSDTCCHFAWGFACRCSSDPCPADWFPVSSCSFDSLVTESEGYTATDSCTVPRSEASPSAPND